MVLQGQCGIAEQPVGVFTIDERSANGTIDLTPQVGVCQIRLGYSFFNHVIYPAYGDAVSFTTW